MFFSNTEYQVIYIDPSAGTHGDGTDPATPWNVLPETVEELQDNTCYLIRRTAENHSVKLPTGRNDSLRNLLLMGMPLESDPMWHLVPETVRVNWGADSAEYANMEINTGDDPWSDIGGPLRMYEARNFLLYRVYAFRNGTWAFQPMFHFPDANYRSSITFEHCKFGAKDIELDRSDFTTATDSTGCKSYIEVNTAHVFSLKHCHFNVVFGENYYGYGHAVYLCNANFTNVSDICSYVTTNNWSDCGTVLHMSNGSWTGSYSNYENIEFNILRNGDRGCVPSLFYAAQDDYCRLRNMKAGILERKLGTTTPARLWVGQTVIQCLANREFDIENIEINLPRCWRVEPECRVCMISGWSNSSVAGYAKTVKNISIQLEETDGIDNESNGLYYDWVKYGNDSVDRYQYSAALELSFSERSYNEGSWEPVIVNNITVNNPRGVAIYGFGCQIKNCRAKGSVKLRRCIADIESVETFYPGYALFAAEGATLRVRRLVLGKENASLVGSVDDPAIGSWYSHSGFIYVDESNGILMSNQGGTETNVWNGYNFICANEVDAGHYTCRSINFVCDTWNVSRTGGAPATLKMYNNTTSGASGTLALGRYPFQGIKLTPDGTGAHVVTAHIAIKGIADLEELGQKLMLQLTVSNGDGTTSTYFSRTSGQWLPDPDSVWNNDSDLNQFMLRMPVSIPVVAPVDVKIHFAWYSANGFVYLDPAIKLEPIA